jgi:hypothetical protein
MSAASNDRKRDADLEQRIADNLKIIVPVGVMVLAVVTAVLMDVSISLLVLAGGALVGVIAMFWSSLRTLLGETPLSGADAYALGAPPRAEEEQKRAVLRALNDLKFERSVGKISEEDYRALEAKYRAEAKRLLRLLDEEAAPRRERAEQLVLRRLRQEGLLEEGKAEAPAREDDAAEDVEKPEQAPKASAPAEPERKAAKAEGNRKKKKGKKSQPTAAGRSCDACGTVNDEDAVFCKKCGARVGAAAETEDPEAQDAPGEEAS